MKTFHKGLFAISSLLMFAGCAQRQPEQLNTGAWRGEFTAQQKQIPFNFVVEDDTAGLVKVYLTNGEEKALLDSVHYKGDSVIIPVEIYDAILIAKLQNDSLKGYFRKNHVAKQGIPFKASRNQHFRFKVDDSLAVKSVQGKWSVSLISDKDGKPSTRYTVGVLEQKGNKVTGSILTTTGDYRYLEGVVDGNQLKLSAFSGSNPSLIEAILTDSIHLAGEYITAGGKVILQAVKNDTAKLPDPYTLTLLKKGTDKLSFSFPDLEGKQVTLGDDKYKGKVVVVTILGSWCPNCIDEASYLAPWYKENKSRGVEIVGLSFERKDDLHFAKERLNKLIKRYDIQYDILFAGLADKKIVAEKLPELTTFISFPTTFFIDKEGKVRKIHTGYNGPATGVYYQEFIKEFNDTINELVKEPAKEVKPV